VTQEFHISVTPVGQDDYLVRTEQVAPGVPLAEELVRWPVADWLTAAGHLMNDPLKSVLQGDVIARNSVNLVALGQQFYNALFQGTLRDSWITAQGIAQNHQQVLRLRLGLKDTRLARLPWEVMHAGDRPLATGPYIAFSRYQSGVLAGSRLLSAKIPKPPGEGGVKVLMVIASPTDQVRLELLTQEAVNLQAELQRPISRPGENGNSLPEIELTLLDQPGREELTQALEQGRYHVLHYSGHSNLGMNGGEIYLVSSRTGLTETLSGDDLAGLLVNNNIQMAVFNSCLGAYRASSDAGGETGERNLTESLVKRGIRSVLAMSERIPDEVALTLTQLFYRNLNQGYPVDLCVSRVRQGLISAYGSHHMYLSLIHI
jgi:CHAT domain-containing protein